MILVDTSVWIDHLRKTNGELSKLLDQGVVLCHPFVIGELACGNMKNRDEILDLFAALPKADMASHEEAMRLVKDRKLWGHGIGWIDVHLLASALLSNCKLWTKDKALQSVSRSLNIGT